MLKNYESLIDDENCYVKTKTDNNIYNVFIDLVTNFQHLGNLLSRYVSNVKLYGKVRD